MPDIPEGFAPVDDSAALQRATSAASIPEGFAPSDITPEQRREATSGAISGLDEGELADMLHPVLGGPGSQAMAGALKHLYSASPYILALLGGMGRGAGAEEAEPSIRAGLTPEERASATDAQIVPEGYLPGPEPAPAPEDAPAPPAAPAEATPEVPPHPAVKAELDVPAIRTKDGQVITGERGMEHKDIIAENPNLPAPVTHGFMRDGQFLTRPQSRALVNAVAGTKLGEGEPDSRQLFPEPQRQIEGPPAEATRYHGTSTPINALRPDTYSTQNIYGQGFYTTDDYDIAKGYSRKGKGGRPTIYNVAEKPGQKLVDLDAPPPPDVRAHINGLKDVSGPEGELGAYFDENPNATLRDWYDEMRAVGSEGSGYNADDVQGAFTSMQETLEGQGYHGLTHVGGRNTGKPPHRVNIYFNPEASVAVPNLPPKPAETQPEAVPNPTQAPSTARMIPAGFEPVDSVK